MTDIEGTAIEIVAETVGKVPEQRAMCSALMRIAGNALAKLTSHEDAGLRHSSLARYHFERMASDNRKGRRA